MATDSPQRSAPGWRPWLMALLLWLVLASLAAVALWHLRRQVLESQTRELGVLSLALTDEIERGLRGAEEGLHALRAELRKGSLSLASDDAAQALHARADLMPLVQSLWMLDKDGRVIAASDATPAPALPTFAPGLEGLAADSSALSRPFVDPRTREMLVALAIRSNDGAGQAGGWMLAAMPAGNLLGAFNAALPAADARMGVFRSDGVRLAGVNVTAPTLDEASQAQHLVNRPSMEIRKFRDGSQNLVGLHKVPRYGLIVLVSRDLRVALLSWREAAQLTTAALVLLLLSMAVSVYVVRRADRRRSEAQRALQTQVMRASKLESLGTLAGGVAHDFNNVLAGIIGFGEMAQDAAAPGSDQARHLDKMLQAALRGKALVERILAFSRGGAHTATVFELELVVEEVLTLLSASLRPGLVLERALDAPGARLYGDPTQAFEAIMNLCTNAMQAMPEGGMLSVQLTRVQIAAPRVLSHSALAAGDYLALVVSDQGSGIPSDVMEHLFEPFFTTRGGQSGTGLGLALVHGVVAELGGAIDVQSLAGQGARFSLYFPECKDALAVSRPLQRRVSAGAGQQLLVVDDEPELVALAQEMLRGLGYQPVGYTDSRAALQAFRDNPQSFAAVITDEVMPQLSGMQMVQALRQAAPHVPVLLLSAYGGPLLAQRAATAGVTQVLAKPLVRADLAAALADLLR